MRFPVISAKKRSTRFSHDDEVGRLVESFNSMVERLRQAQVELRSYHYQQMERADRLASVGEMSAGIAHEIKNPLAAISGAISVLADDYPADDPRREVVDKVLEQITRIDTTLAAHITATDKKFAKMDSEEAKGDDRRDTWMRTGLTSVVGGGSVWAFIEWLRSGR